MFLRSSKSLIAIIIMTLFMGVIAMPNSIKSKLPDHKALNWIKTHKITLGLDLQGGAQLDYKIDLRNAHAKNQDDDKDNDVRINDIIEGVRTTIERRVNGLGVSEPQIYLSKVGDEQHIIVELAGVKDEPKVDEDGMPVIGEDGKQVMTKGVDKAKEIVGKTIQLEFKERKKEIDPNLKNKIKARADETLKKALKKDADFIKLGQNTATIDKKIQFRVNKMSFEADLPEHYKKVLPKLKDKQVYKSIIEGSDNNYTVGADGKPVQTKGYYVLQMVKSEMKEKTEKKQAEFSDIAKAFSKKLETLNDKSASNFEDKEAGAIWDMTYPGANIYTDVLEVKDELRVYKLIKHNKGEKEVKASHILLAYKGANRADPKVTRSKEEAKKEAEKVLKEVEKDSDKFADLAKKYSDGPSGAAGGDLGFFGTGKMTKAFEDAAFAMEKGKVSKLVETDFGYHIIKVTDIKSAKDETVNLELLKLKKSDENKKKLTEELKKTNGYDVTIKKKHYKFNEIFFDLAYDPWKQTGLDGSHFKFATVTYNQIGASEVSIRFDKKGADLFEEITERLVNQPLAIFVGGELISAPNVNQKISGGSAVITGSYSPQEAIQLANDLNTGAIDAPIILTGQYSISATLGDSALNVSLLAGLIGLVLLALYMIVYYRLFGVFAVLALLIYSVIIIFILNVAPIVMTLAGIAGIILSIGMAVDANILIFERTREELNTGKNFSASITAGFERAWSSIRDSNVSSLITCAILYSFGNSIIKGFALMLAIGIVISMFTAITVTKKFLQSLTGTSLSKKRFLLGVKKVETVNR